MSDSVPMMNQEIFLSCITELLGETDPAATEMWFQYAEELDQAGTVPKDAFFDQTCGELQFIKGEYGLDIARQLYRCGQTFTFSPFELRTAAEHLKAGIPIERVAQMALEGDFFTMPARYHKNGILEGYRQNGLPVPALKKAWDHAVREVHEATERINAAASRHSRQKNNYER